MKRKQKKSGAAVTSSEPATCVTNTLGAILDAAYGIMGTRTQWSQQSISGKWLAGLILARASREEAIRMGCDDIDDLEALLTKRAASMTIMRVATYEEMTAVLAGEGPAPTVPPGDA